MLIKNTEILSGFEVRTQTKTQTKKLPISEKEAKISSSVFSTREQIAEPSTLSTPSGCPVKLELTVLVKSHILPVVV